MTTNEYKTAIQNPTAAIQAALRERESFIVHGNYIGHVLALQNQGLITSVREGDKLRVTRKESSDDNN